MSRKKPVPDLIRDGNRFSGKDMRKSKNTRWCFARHTISFKSDASACGCRTGSPPGALAVTHAELGDGRFLFKLDIVHPRLGRLICQTAAFEEAQP